MANDNKNTSSFSVIGGDVRFSIIAEKLEKSGFNVISCFLAGESNPVQSEVDFAAAATADSIILPLPSIREGAHINVSEAFLSRFGLDITQIPTLFELLGKLKKGSRVFGGMLPAWFMRRCEENGIKAFDYFKQEELEIRNVVPTVEGCIEILLSRLSTTLYGREVLITGYGRIGKLLARYLKAFGARVSVAARKSGDLAWIEIDGHSALDYSVLCEALRKSEIVINTVPSVIFGLPEIASIQNTALVIDLASQPGAFDKTALRQHENRFGFIHALSLPGKTAPQSAAGYIFDAIIKLANPAEKDGGIPAPPKPEENFQ